MESSSLVTIGIPTYNRCTRLGKAIESAMAQTYANLEILISDNCSTDETEYLCHQYQSKDERIIYDGGVGVLIKNSATLEYDYKNNPLKNILGYSKLLDHFNSISSNNIVSSYEVSSYQYMEGQTTSSANIDKMIYKYDGGDYPTEMVSSTSIFGNETSDTIKSLLYY